MEGSCKHCGRCCRYYVFEPWMFKHDMQWLSDVGGRMAGEKYALVYRPCPQLENDDCKIYDRRSQFCREWPGKYEDCNHEWLKAIGCRYFEEVYDALSKQETENCGGDSGASAGEIIQEERSDEEDVEGTAS